MAADVERPQPEQIRLRRVAGRSPRCSVAPARQPASVATAAIMVEPFRKGSVLLSITRHHCVDADRGTVKGIADLYNVGFCVIDYSAALVVARPPLHVHDAIDEACYLLRRLEMQVGDERRLVGAAGFLLVPRQRHTPSSTRGQVVPGGSVCLHGNSPRDVGGPWDDCYPIRASDDGTIAEIFQRYGTTTILGPPSADYRRVDTRLGADPEVTLSDTVDATK
jgi:hypothetical protein